MTRPTYSLTIRPEANRGAGDIRALRALLKDLLRRHGFRALTISEQTHDGQHESGDIPK